MFPAEEQEMLEINHRQEIIIAVTGFTLSLYRHQIEVIVRTGPTSKLKYQGKRMGLNFHFTTYPPPQPTTKFSTSSMKVSTFSSSIK